MTLAELAGAWTFSRPGSAGPQILPCQAQERAGRLVVSVPGLGAGGLTVELQLDADRLVGTFGLGETKGDVEFEVRSDGKRLVGHPHGFANRETWRLTRA